MFNEEELKIVKERALENHIPILMDDTMEKIEEILKKEKPKRILEIGTAVGYSASMFAKNTDEDCIIDTIEISEERAKEAQENIEKIGVKEKINIYIGNAVEILPTMNNEYDIVFIDAAKGKYPIFLEHAIRMIKNEGLILADNILYKGYVMSDYNEHKQRTAVRHLREYIKEITENDKCESEILEVGDGLAITRVRK
ncbi:MAG: O-methyltransferase [Clostridia bacterium]|nr:O-methyltransferase [Clostridia bacterium]